MPYKHTQSRGHSVKKRSTFNRSWSQYNASLKARGNMTIWLSSDVVDQWVEKNVFMMVMARLIYIVIWQY